MASSRKVYIVDASYLNNEGVRQDATVVVDNKTTMNDWLFTLAVANWEGFTADRLPTSQRAVIQKFFDNKLTAANHFEVCETQLITSESINQNAQRARRKIAKPAAKTAGSR